ncbi:MAG TPA: PxKF domain-containing protein [Kineosporiaceae bacterium]|nr:PxKF domain-containing protein [Kineosporiaceae bacterium]
MHALRKIPGLLATTAALTLLSPALARADEVFNTIDTTVDSTVEVMTLTAFGPDGVTGIAVRPTHGDGGCHVQDNTAGGGWIELTFRSGDDTVATVSPTTMRFRGCNEQPLTVTPRQEGTTRITAVLTRNATKYDADTFDLLPAAFDVTVGPQPAALIADSTPPVITATVDPAAPDGNAGWYRSDIALTWTVSEPESPGTLVTTGCDDVRVTSDQPATTYTCAATSAGGQAEPVSVTLQRDATPPEVSAGTVTGIPGTGGWFVSPVTVEFLARDALSGPAVQSGTVTSQGEGPAVVVAGPAFTDVAGNTTPAGAASVTVKIDTSPPSVPTFTGGGLADGARYYYGFIPGAPTGCDSTDPQSGIVSCTLTPPAGEGLVGTHTYTATAVNGAGLSSSATLTYTVLPWDLHGFATPLAMSPQGSIVWNPVKGGSTVPLRFEVFAGDTELTSTAVVRVIQVRQVQPVTGAPVADIPLTPTGGTALRYDPTAGQFVDNWQTPRTSGIGYCVTVVTADGSAIIAYVKTR